MTSPSIPGEPARGTVEYYATRLRLAVDVNDLHARALGLVSSALAGGDPAERLQRIENVLAATDEVTRKLLGPPPYGSEQAPR